MKRNLLSLCLVVASGPAVAAASFVFSTGNVTNSIAVASRPASTGKIEIEAADDFVLTLPTKIDGATFYGVLPGVASTVTRVVTKIYRVYPLDSNSGRTPNVPTRTNTPADVDFASADSAAATLNFSATVLSASFTALNSVLNGINAKPNQTTGGEGVVGGAEARIDVSFGTPLALPAGHYFFVAEVQLGSGDFFWLSGTRPIVAPGTPFSPDLQASIRNQNLAPDWLRIGTDIIGGASPPTYNLAFALSGDDDSIFANGFN